MGAPSLEFDWEVGIFRALRGLWRWLRPEPPPPWDTGRVAHLSEHQRAFTVLAQIIAGSPVRVQPARNVGGVRGKDLLLPPYLDLAPDPEANRGLYVVRVVVNAAMARGQGWGDGHSRPKLGARGDAPHWQQRILDLQGAAEAVSWLGDQLPRFAEAHDEAAALMLALRPPLDALKGRERLLEEATRDALQGGCPWEDASLTKALASARDGGLASPGVPIWGGYIPLDLSALEAANAEGGESQRPSPQSEREAPPIEEIRAVTLSKRQQEAAVLQHTFEKVETADSYHGGGRDTDGADDLDAHLEALQEVDFAEVIRGGAPAESLLKADIQLGAEVPDVAGLKPEGNGLRYDEWDFRARAYRPQWCTVYPVKGGPGAPEWAADALRRHRRLVDELRRRLMAQRTRLRPQTRQLDGEDVDVAAIVDEHAAQLAGHGGEERLYTRRRRAERSYATTVLLDISLSTDAWVANRRVLDVSREALLVLGEVADSLGDQLQIIAFASHTRNRCLAWEILGFNEPWRRGRARLGALRPQGYTRIGPALRHGCAQLAAAPADRRLLLLISDGKPTDYDRYEGRYGIADVRQALREAGRQGVVAHALAVEAAARDHLPAMFGPGAWHILPRPEALPGALTKVYGQLTGL